MLGEKQKYTDINFIIFLELSGERTCCFLQAQKLYFCERILWGWWDDPVLSAPASWLQPHWSRSWRSQTAVLHDQRTLSKLDVSNPKQLIKRLYMTTALFLVTAMRSLPGELLESSAVEISSGPLIRLWPSIGSQVTSSDNLDTNWARNLRDQTPMRRSATEFWWTQHPKWHDVLVRRHHFDGWFRFS